MVSVDRTGGDHPGAGLAGDGGNFVEVLVVVKHDQSVGLRSGSDEEFGDLAPALALGREVAPDLLGSCEVIGGGDWLDGIADGDRSRTLVSTR